MNTGTMSQVAENVSAYSKTNRTGKTEKAGKTYGRTIGNPELSDKAQKYYEQLKSKFSDMDFILVSSEEKDRAEANASRYAAPGKTVVLIDEEKIEKMAEDEAYREKYEGIITNARTQIAQMKSGLTDSGVKSYGIKINDNGTASYFAVVDKSLAAQKERIEKKAEEKAQEKKEAAKEAKEEAREIQLKEARELRKEHGKTELVTVTASTVEELIQKVKDVSFASRSDYVQTDAEKQVGQHFDAKL
ncbi:MAG: DUF6033 family protein [Roseburia sp.]